MKTFFKNIFIVFIIIAVSVLASCKSSEDENNIVPEVDDGSIKGKITEPTIFSKINTSGGADYVISGILSVESELTIDSGVVIEMDAASGIVVKTLGTIMALGSSTHPITITGKSKTRGFWNYIMVNSTDPRNELRFVNIEYGGGDASNDGSVFINAGGLLKIHNCTIKDSKSHALVAADANSTLSGFSNNTISENQASLKIRPKQISQIAASNTFTNNASAFITVIGSTVNTPQTWQKNTLPFLFKGKTTIEADVFIEAGVEITFDYESSILVKPNGSLKAIGTNTERILFNAYEVIPGYWHGIIYQSRSLNNELSFVDVNHGGGSPSFFGAVHIGGAISFPEATLKIGNCNFNNSAKWGVYIQPNAELINLGGNGFNNNIYGNIGP